MHDYARYFQINNCMHSINYILIIRINIYLYANIYVEKIDTFFYTVFGYLFYPDPPAPNFKNGLSSEDGKKQINCKDMKTTKELAR